MPFADQGRALFTSCVHACVVKKRQALLFYDLKQFLKMTCWARPDFQDVRPQVRLMIYLAYIIINSLPVFICGNDEVS